MSAIRIPADIDQEDRLLAGLTARQLGLLAIPAVALWMLYLATRNIVPLPVFIPFAVIVSGGAGTLVVIRHDGVTLERFATAALRFHRSPKRYVVTGTDMMQLPSSVAALNLPVMGVDRDGVVECSDGNFAILCRAQAINLRLHSTVEQEALTTAFGRFCNGLNTSMQIVVRTEPVNMEVVAADLERRAPELPAVGLERAARDHARFLRELGQRHDVMRRVVLMVFRDAHSPEALIRKATDAVTTLRTAGIELRLLGQEEAIAAIQRAATPEGPEHPLFDEFVTGVKQ